MQFLIDTDTETPAGMLHAARLLVITANAMSDGADELGADIMAATHTHPRQRPSGPARPAAPPVGPAIKDPAPPAPLPPGNVPPPPVEHPEVHPDAVPKDVPAGTDEELDPAKVFGGGTSAPLAAATAPAAQTAAATVAANTSAPGVPTGGASASDERDAAGLPWDARVHSETKKKNADGTWRFRRNLDAAVRDSVMVELRAQYGQQQIGAPSNVTLADVANTLAATPANVPPPPPPADDGVRYSGQTATVVPPPPAATTVSVPPPPSDGVSNTNQSAVLPPVTSFRDLMQKVNVALAGGRLTQAQLTEACKSAGVDTVTALAAQPILVPTVDQYLNRWLAVAA